MTTPGTGAGTGASVTDTTKEAARGEAAEVGETARGAAQQVAQTGSEQASQVASEAADRARDLGGQVRDQVQQQVGEQQDRLVALLRDLSEELHAMADSTAGGPRAGLATDVARQSAQRCWHLAGYLERHDATDVLDDVRGFARRRPGTFLLGAAAAGVVLGRLTRGVKDDSSSDRDERRSYGELPPRETTYTGTGDWTATGVPGSTATGTSDADLPLMPPEPTMPLGAGEPLGGIGQGGRIASTDPYDPEGGRR